MFASLVIGANFIKNRIRSCGEQILCYIWAALSKNGSKVSGAQQKLPFGENGKNICHHVLSFPLTELVFVSFKQLQNLVILFGAKS